MEISRRDWSRYSKKLSAINQKATDTMQAYMDANPDADDDELIRAAVGIADKYGEAAGALSCEMYDSTAKASGANVPPAEPAEVPDYGETAKAVRGTMKNHDNTVPATVGRMVKQVGADTMLKNAKRDQAQFAWIPNGDTCAFCMTIASSGWQYMRADTLKHGHAEHIHANCDCEFAIRFDSDTNVEGYDPERYRKIYDEAEGDTPDEKINAIRRAQYAVETGKDATVTEALHAEKEKVFPTFTPAKTIEEAEEFAKQFTTGGKYSTVSYSGIDVEFANEFNHAMNDVMSQFEPPYKLRNIGAMNMRKKEFAGSTADAAYRWGTNDLFYNKGFYKTAKEHAKHMEQLQELTDQVMPHLDALIEKYKGETGFMAQKQLAYLEALKESGRSNVATDPYSVMVHELGHYLDDTIFRAEFKRRGFSVRDSFAEFSQGISGYATQSNQEYVAESFLAFWRGETDGLDPALVDIFKGVMK